MSNESGIMSASEGGGCEREGFLPKDSTNVTVDELHSSSGKAPKINRFRRWLSKYKKWTVGLFVLAIAIVAIGVLAHLLVHKKKCDNCAEHNATVSTVEQLIQEDYLANSNRLCSIKIPANTSRLEGQSCLNERKDCYPCNGTCLGADTIRVEINKHIKCNNSQPYIDCCVVLSVSGNGQCGNHGDLVCINSKSLPVCQCHLGWTETFCNETDVVKALCKCGMSNQTIAYENTVPSCYSVGRPNDWNFCLHVSVYGTKCICDKSGFFKDEKAHVDCFNDIPHDGYVHS